MFKTVALALCLALAGCAQYSACVKAAVGPAIKAVTLTQVEQQVTVILNTAVDGAWVQAGLTAVVDACNDTNCRALVSCAAQAWRETHPAAKPEIKAAAQAFLDRRDTVQCAQYASR